jgi:hypothetical protein
MSRMVPPMTSRIIAMTYTCIASGDMSPESPEKGLMVNMESGLLRSYSLKI